jgi:UDP-galactose transporter
VQLPSHFSRETSPIFKYFHLAKGELVTSTHVVHDKAVGVKEQMNRTLGITAVFAACLLSGLAGVYFEKVLKGSNKTIWLRNVQLSFFSLFPALFIGVLWKDGHEVLKKVFNIHIIRTKCTGVFLWI